MSNNEVRKTKVFISSSAQVELKDFRLKLRDALNNAGHSAVAFENDIGLYSTDTIQDCLDKVDECDVFLLYLSNKAGSFLEDDPNYTVTYAEYRQAYNSGLIIIPIIESHILDAYRNNVGSLIAEEAKKYQEQHDWESDTYPLVKKIFGAKKNKAFLKPVEALNVDPFIWAFIYDIYTQRWAYDYDRSDTLEVTQFALESLSQLLYKSKDFFLEQDLYKTVIESHMELATHKENTEMMLKCLNEGKLNVEAMLNEMMSFLTGGPVQKTLGVQSKLAFEIEDCHAITLYERSKTEDRLNLIHSAGEVSAQSYELSADSFVTEAYNQEFYSENFFYSEEKSKLYMVRREKELVLSCQFKITEGCKEKRIKTLENEINSVIMKNKLSFDTAVKILGGML